MIYISEHTKANDAEFRWARQYLGTTHVPSIKIADELKTLGRNPEPAEVNEIIGNDCWTTSRCDECGSTVYDVVQLGQELDYESSTAWICRECLIKALELFPKGEAT